MEESEELVRPLTVLAGVGPRRAERLARLGLATVRDLLVLAPRGFERQGGQVSVAEACERVGEELSVTGRFGSVRIFRRGRGRSVVRADLADDSGRMRALFFNQPWIHRRLRELADAGDVVELYGRVVETKSGPALSAPRFATESRPLPAPGTVLPVYALTEGVGQGFLRALVREAVDRFAPAVVDPLPAAARAELDLPDLPSAVRELHEPRSEASFLAARRRLALERLLALQARFVARAGPARGRARALRIPAGRARELVDRLPLRPTAAQRRVMHEIARDLARESPMRRLLQGDVGSGKTLVALFAIAAAAEAGGQSALLVPTELLAEQHYLGLRDWLAAAGIRAVLLTGSLGAGARRSAQEELARGAARLAIGTHALLSEGLSFRRLDLAIVDEQQRFGVAQKQALLDKGRDVHVLLMTATPIPRTLALCVYGDLDTSLLAEKPPGRGEVRTRFVPPARRRDLLDFLERRLAAGERAFWVCPRIGSDAAGEEGASAEEARDELSAHALARHGVELLHGRIPPEERARRIERFRRGDARLLVGTTIVEVGVDVPEATVMVIEGAERFGLSQLHQLRGRVGRGPRPSWCLLLGASSAREHLGLLERTSDGFAIAEEDLRRRGMGDLAGLRQAGRNVEGLEDPVTDLELVLLARRLVTGDPALAERYARFGAGAEPAIV